MGKFGDILRINLTEGTVKREALSDGKVRQYLGGRGRGPADRSRRSRRKPLHGRHKKPSYRVHRLQQLGRILSVAKGTYRL